MNKQEPVLQAAYTTNAQAEILNRNSDKNDRINRLVTELKPLLSELRSCYESKDNAEISDNQESRQLLMEQINEMVRYTDNISNGDVGCISEMLEKSQYFLNVCFIVCQVIPAKKSSSPMLLVSDIRQKFCEYEQED